MGFLKGISRYIRNKEIQTQKGSGDLELEITCTPFFYFLLLFIWTEGKSQYFECSYKSSMQMTQA